MIAVGIENKLRRMFPGVLISLGYNVKGRFLYLARIIVPVKKRRQGLGTQVMIELNRMADDLALPVVLTPTTDFGTPKRVLKKFYKNLGYVEDEKNMRRN